MVSVVSRIHNSKSVRENTCSGSRRINTLAFSLISASCSFLHRESLLCSNESDSVTEGFGSKPKADFHMFSL